MSKWGDLIVSDPSNSHVVRLTTDGELVEIIGREGAGPGEFNTPGAVGIETGKDILWVADWTLRRINRYRLLEQTSEFLNSFPIPVGLMLHPQLMTINDSHSYWAVGVAIGSRIAHIDDTGKIHKVFGDFFSSTRYSGSMRHFSEGVVTLTPTGDVLFIGCYQPVIERWTATGELLATTEFPFPETERTKRRERSMPEDRLTYYQLGVAWDETRSHIFLRMNDITTYSVLPESTGVIHRHVVTDVTEAERREWGFPGPFVVSDKGGSIRFFFFDRNGGVRATRPKEP